MKDFVLLDTDVVSYIFKNDSRANLFKKDIVGLSWAISFVTVAELEKWVMIRNWEEKRISQLYQFIEKFLILGYERKIAQNFAIVQSHSIKSGHPMGFEDSWIAATALTYDISLATHNLSDYENTPNLKLVIKNK